MANEIQIPKRIQRTKHYTDAQFVNSWSQLEDDINLIDKNFDTRLQAIEKRRGAQVKDANFNVTLADEGDIFLVDTSGGLLSVSLPPVASVGLGFEVGFKKSDISLSFGVNQININTNGLEIFEDGTLTYNIGVPYEIVWLRCDGTKWLIAYDSNTSFKTSWNPQLLFGGLDTGITYSTRSGTLIRKRFECFVSFTMNVSVKSSAVGAATVGPIPVVPTGPLMNALSPGLSGMLTGLTGALQLDVTNNSIRVLQGTATGNIQLTDVNFGTGNLRGSGGFNLISA